MIVWASLMPTDVTPKIVTLAERYADPRLIHYWDDSGRIARAFAAALGLAPGQSVNNVFLLYGPDDTWDPDRTMDQGSRRITTHCWLDGGRAPGACAWESIARSR